MFFHSTIKRFFNTLCDCKQRDLNVYMIGVLLICCEEFGISEAQLLSGSRFQEIIDCRKAFCQVIKETLDIKNEVPAKLIGKPHGYVSRYLRTQPNNKHYLSTLSKIRERVATELSFQRQKNQPKKISAMYFLQRFLALYLKQRYFFIVKTIYV